METMWKLFFTHPIPKTTAVEAHTIPSPFNTLLPPNHHMTQTLESHFNQPVVLHVIATQHKGDEYARAITLRVTQPQPRTVQFAIVRIDLTCFEESAKEEILKQQAPLGRILKSQGIRTAVEVHEVVKIEEGNEELEKHIKLPTYGRFAVIHCNGKPGLFLLEILSGDC
jgi:hypothetical protein